MASRGRSRPDVSPTANVANAVRDGPLRPSIHHAPVQLCSASAAGLRRQRRRRRLGVVVPGRHAEGAGEGRERVHVQVRPHTAKRAPTHAALLTALRALSCRLTPNAPLPDHVELAAADTLKLELTALDGKKAKRPHQAFLTLTEPRTGVQESFVLAVKANGKAKLELVRRRARMGGGGGGGGAAPLTRRAAPAQTHKDLPQPFLAAPTAAVPAAVVLGSFGSARPYRAASFTLALARDANVPVAAAPAPERYAAAPEIRHVFRGGPRSPPKAVTLVFSAAVLAALPALLAVWLRLGANAAHVGDALARAPIAHLLFLGSILAMEAVFFMYYAAWSLFQTLPAAALVGCVAFLSGSRALSEVQERRLAGKR